MTEQDVICVYAWFGSGHFRVAVSRNYVLKKVWNSTVGTDHKSPCDKGVYSAEPKRKAKKNIGSRTCCTEDIDFFTTADNFVGRGTILPLTCRSATV